MVIGTDNFGNGPAKVEGRFLGQPSNYSPSPADRRDSSAARPRIEQLAEPRPERVATPLDSPPPIASSMEEPTPVDPPLAWLGPPGGRVFSNHGWLDTSGGSLADHPLLRGLLQELPPKGLTPSQDWLDRWFEAARSILELLYSHEVSR